MVLYQDELTYYRQPSRARSYEARGRSQPLAVRSHAANTATRVAATLDAFTARVVPWQGTRFDIPQVVKFYQQVRAAYPELSWAPPAPREGWVRLEGVRSPQLHVSYKT